MCGTDGWNFVKEERNQRTENTRPDWKLASARNQRAFIEGLRCMQRRSEWLQGTVRSNVLHNKVHVWVQPRKVSVPITRFKARQEHFLSKDETKPILQCTFRYWCWNFFINKMLMKISFGSYPLSAQLKKDERYNMHHWKQKTCHNRIICISSAGNLGSQKTFK